MLNFLKSNKPWMIASLFAVTSVFGEQSCNPCKPVCEPCEPCVPHELLQCPTVAAYNAPARVDTQCSWDIWVDASFIYWQAMQDMMEPAHNRVNPVTTTLGTNSFSFVNMEYQYKPGFKVGLGMSFDFDNWDASVEYTRLHQTIHRSAAMSAAAATAGEGYWPLWLDGIVTTSTALYSNNVNAFNAHWHLNLDFLDADLGRWYYVGTQLTFRPSIGMRAAWIKQRRDVHYLNVLNSAFSMNGNDKQHCWGVGPRFTLDTNWLIGDGFRLFGNSAFDILFTQYMRSFHCNDNLAGTPSLILLKKGSSVNKLRGHLDMELGAAWGTYFDCHNWHIDLSASYGFQVFWHQNMFNWPIARNTNYGNLYVHGLTVTAKLDF